MRKKKKFEHSESFEEKIKFENNMCFGSLSLHMHISKSASGVFTIDCLYLVDYSNTINNLK